MERKSIGPYPHRTVSGHTQKSASRIHCISDLRISPSGMPTQKHAADPCDASLKEKFPGTDISVVVFIYFLHCHHISLFPILLAFRKLLEVAGFFSDYCKYNVVPWNNTLKMNFWRTLKNIPSFVNDIYSLSSRMAPKHYQEREWSTNEYGQKILCSWRAGTGDPGIMFSRSRNYTTWVWSSPTHCLLGSKAFLKNHDIFSSFS